MNIRTPMMICLILIGVCALIGGTTYSVFSDAETSEGNEMTVSINYYVPPPGFTPDYSVSLDMLKCSNDNNAKGVFSYDPESYRFFWKYDGDVPYADPQNATTKMWALVTEHPSTGKFIVLGTNTTEHVNPFKRLVIEGSYEFNGNLNAPIYIIEFDKFNATSIEPFPTHCIHTADLVNYTDTYPW